jgi:hypothetical protein
VQGFTLVLATSAVALAVNAGMPFYTATPIDARVVDAETG